MNKRKSRHYISRGGPRLSQSCRADCLAEERCFKMCRESLNVILSGKISRVRSKKQAALISLRCVADHDTSRRTLKTWPCDHMECDNSGKVGIKCRCAFKDTLPNRSFYIER